MTQPGHKLIPIWDDDMTGGGFNCCATMTVPHIIDIFSQQEKLRIKQRKSILKAIEWGKKLKTSSYKELIHNINAFNTTL